MTQNGCGKNASSIACGTKGSRSASFCCFSFTMQTCRQRQLYSVIMNAGTGSYNEIAASSLSQQ